MSADTGVPDETLTGLLWLPSVVNEHSDSTARLSTDPARLVG